VKFLPKTPAGFAAAGLLLLLLFLFLLLPPVPARLDPGPWADLAARTVAGAYHVHSARSDGAADKPAIAAAAAAAGLRFLILTDHGDATRPPDPPIYINGVLCLDAVEISTDEGHYVALDMPRAPYPLGGAAADVVEDVARLGGFGIAAHPDSEKAALRWTDEDAPIDGIEWLNGDSEWRDESRRTLWRVGASYFFRPGPALALVLDRPTTLDRWDRLASSRPIVAIAGLDAHGGIGRRAEDGSLSGVLGVPSYKASFQAFSNRIVLERPWSGDAAADARALWAAIRSGRVYTTVDAVAAPGLLDFHAKTKPGGTTPQLVPMGGILPEGASATLVARALKPAGAQIVLVHDGRDIAASSGELRQTITQGKGAYRIEVRVLGAPGDPPVPWIVSNPIYFLAPRPRAIQMPPNGAETTRITPDRWHIEKDRASSAVLRTGSGEVEFQYTLGMGDRASQYAALAAELPREPFRQVAMKLAANRPMRVSLQLRDTEGRRWGRSAYIPPDGRELLVPLGEFRPIANSAFAPDPRTLKSVLVVVDLTNSSPGSSGTLHLRCSELVK